MIAMKTTLSIEDDKPEEVDNDWSYISLGDQRQLGIRTSGLDDKETACEMLVCYARELKGNSIMPHIMRLAP